MDKKLYDMTLSELKAFRKVVDDVIKEKEEERREREISIQRVDAQVRR